MPVKRHSRISITLRSPSKHKALSQCCFNAARISNHVSSDSSPTGFYLVCMSTYTAQINIDLIEPINLIEI